MVGWLVAVEEERTTSEQELQKNIDDLIVYLSDGKQREMEKHENWFG